jgi:hypothetical protein
MLCGVMGTRGAMEDAEDMGRRDFGVFVFGGGNEIAFSAQ